MSLSARIARWNSNIEPAIAHALEHVTAELPRDIELQAVSHKPELVNRCAQTPVIQELPYFAIVARSPNMLVQNQTAKSDIKRRGQNTELRFTLGNDSVIAEAAHYCGGGRVRIAVFTERDAERFIWEFVGAARTRTIPSEAAGA